jgi:uncharacterized surface protein with fasciclin (FAS1) repeats
MKSTTGTTAVNTAAGRNIVQTASALKPFTTFTTAIRAAGLSEMLTGAGPFTVFAPTDRAFAKMKSGELDALLVDKPRLAALLSHHVVAGRVKAPQPEKTRMATPVDGTDLTVRALSGGGAYRVNDAKLVRTNIRATNGVIHAIDTVLTAR